MNGTESESESLSLHRKISCIQPVEECAKS